MGNSTRAFEKQKEKGPGAAARTATTPQNTPESIFTSPAHLYRGGTLEAQSETLHHAEPPQQQTMLKEISHTQGNQHSTQLVARLQSAVPPTLATSTPEADALPGTETIETLLRQPGRAAPPGEPTSGARTRRLGIQAQLQVSQPDDPYEREADRVAETVMRMATPLPRPIPPTANPSPTPPTLSRSPLPVARIQPSPEKPALAPKPHPPAAPPKAPQALHEEPVEQPTEQLLEDPRKLPPALATPPPDDRGTGAEKKIQRAARPALEAGAGIESEIASLKGRGTPLPPQERAFFESRMGRDFSKVRIHTGSQAIQTARDLNARAYAIGPDIAFNEGEYAPGTPEGRRLLAHELTHVVQQGQSSEKVDREVTPGSENVEQYKADFQKEADAGLQQLKLQENGLQQQSATMNQELEQWVRESVTKLALLSRRAFMQTQGQASDAVQAAYRERETARQEARQTFSPWRGIAKQRVKQLQDQAQKNPMANLDQMEPYAAGFKKQVLDNVSQSAGSMGQIYRNGIMNPLITRIQSNLQQIQQVNNGAWIEFRKQAEATMLEANQRNSKLTTQADTGWQNVSAAAQRLQNQLSQTAAETQGRIADPAAAEDFTQSAQKVREEVQLQWENDQKAWNERRNSVTSGFDLLLTWGRQLGLTQLEGMESLLRQVLFTKFDPVRSQMEQALKPIGKEEIQGTLKGAFQRTGIEKEVGTEIKIQLKARSGYPGRLQPKLAVSQPGDPQEVEADQTADRVMGMPTDPEPAAAPAKAPAPEQPQAAVAPVAEVEEKPLAPPPPATGLPQADMQAEKMKPLESTPEPQRDSEAQPETAATPAAAQAPQAATPPAPEKQPEAQAPAGEAAPQTDTATETAPAEEKKPEETPPAAEAEKTEAGAEKEKTEEETTPESAGKTPDDAGDPAALAGEAQPAVAEPPAPDEKEPPTPAELTAQSLPEARTTFKDSVDQIAQTGQTLRTGMQPGAALDPAAAQQEKETLSQAAAAEREAAVEENAAAQEKDAATAVAAPDPAQPEAPTRPATEPTPEAQKSQAAADRPAQPTTTAAQPAPGGSEPQSTAQDNAAQQGEAQRNQTAGEVDQQTCQEASNAIVETMGSNPPAPQKPQADTSPLEAEKSKIGDKDDTAVKNQDGTLPAGEVATPEWTLTAPNPTIVFTKRLSDQISSQPEADSNIEGRISRMQSGGAPLPEKERAFFEPRLGRDLSGVRIHTGSEAVQLNRELGARAFTVGRHIAFGEGEFQPGNTDSRWLMAHELAHVGQNGAEVKRLFNWKAWARRILRFVQAIVNSESFLLGILQIAKSTLLSTLERLKTRLMQALMSGEIGSINMKMVTEEFSIENLETALDQAISQQAETSAAKEEQQSESGAAEVKSEGDADTQSLQQEQQQQNAALEQEQSAAETEIKTEAETKEAELREAESEAETTLEAQHQEAETESQVLVTGAEEQIEADVRQLQSDAETYQSQTDEKVQQQQTEAQSRLDEVKQQAEEAFSPEQMAEKLNLDRRAEEAMSVPADQYPAHKARLYEEIVTEARGQWNEFKTNVMDKTAGEVQFGFKELQDSVTAGWKGLQGQGQALMNSAQEMMAGVRTQLTGIWSAVTDQAGLLQSNLKELATTAWTNLQNKATALWTDLQGKATAAWNQLKENAAQVWTNLKGRATAVWNNLKTIFTGDVDGLKALGTQALSNLKDTVMKSLSNLKDKALESLKKMGMDLVKKVAEQIAKNVFAAAAQAGASAAAVATTAAKAAPAAVFLPSEAFRMIGKTVKAGAQNLAKLAKNAVKSLTQLKERGQGFWNRLSQSGQQAQGGLQNFGGNMLNTLQNLATNAGQNLIQRGTTALQNLATQAQSACNNLLQMGTQAWNGLKAAGEQLWNGLKSMGERAWNGLQNFGGSMQGLLQKGWTGLQNLWKNRNALMEKGFDKLVGWGKSIAVEQIAGFLEMEPKEIYNLYNDVVKPRIDKTMLAIGENKVVSFVQQIFGMAAGGGPGTAVQAKRRPGAVGLIQRAVEETAAPTEEAAPENKAPAAEPTVKPAEPLPTEAQLPAGEEKMEPGKAEEGEKPEQQAAAATTEGEAKAAEATAEEEQTAAETEAREAQTEEALAGQAEATAKDGKAAEAPQTPEAAALVPELIRPAAPQIATLAPGVDAGRLAAKEAALWARIAALVAQLRQQDSRKTQTAPQLPGNSPAAAETETAAAPGKIESQIASLRGSGSPLPKKERSFFENRMGADFSRVRVHTGTTAVETSRNLQARAYTVGNDIAFNAGEYAPGTTEGRRLLAHELTHVVQQGGAGGANSTPATAARRIQRASALEEYNAIIELPLEKRIPELIKFAGTYTTTTKPWDQVVDSWLKLAEQDNFLAVSSGSLKGAWDQTLAQRGDTLWPAVLAQLEARPEIKLQFILDNWAGRGANQKEAFLATWQKFWSDGVLKSINGPQSALWEKSLALLKAEIVRAACTALDPAKDDLAQSINFIVMHQWDNGGNEFGAKVVELWGQVVQQGDIVNAISGGASFAALWDITRQKLGSAELGNLFGTVIKAQATPEAQIKFLLATWERGASDYQETYFVPAWTALAQSDTFITALEAGTYDALWQPSLKLLGKDFVKAVEGALSEEGAIRFVTCIGYEDSSFFGRIGQYLEMKNKFQGLLSDAVGVVKAVIKNPGGFVGTLSDGVLQGVRNFGSRLGENLQAGFLEWLTGAIGGAGIQLPQTWDLKGAFSLSTQILGLTYDNVKARAVNILGSRGAQVISFLETGLDVFVTLQKEGLAGLWEWVKDKVGTIADQVIGAVKDMLVTEVVEAGIGYLVKILGGPAGAIIQAIQTIYGIIVWFRDNAARMAELFTAVVQGIQAIANGDNSGVARYVEEALKKGIAPAIDFLAGMLGLGKLNDKITKALETVREPVNKGIDYVLGLVKDFVDKTARALGFGDDTTPEGQIGKKVSFTAGTEDHNLWVKKEGTQATLMMASENPGALVDKLASWRARQDLDFTVEEKAEFNDRLNQIQTLLNQTDSKGDALCKEEARKLIDISSINAGLIELEEAEDHLSVVVRETLVLMNKGTWLNKAKSAFIDLPFTPEAMVQKLGIQAPEAHDLLKRWESEKKVARIQEEDQEQFVFGEGGGSYDTIFEKVRGRAFLDDYCNGTWSQARNLFIAGKLSEKNMLSLVQYREAVVGKNSEFIYKVKQAAKMEGQQRRRATEDRIKNMLDGKNISGITVKLPSVSKVEFVEFLALGSTKPTSDLDYSVSGELAEQAIEIFNATFRAMFGKESGTYFDTNAYTSDSKRSATGANENELSPEDREGDHAYYDKSTINGLAMMMMNMTGDQWNDVEKEVCGTADAAIESPTAEKQVGQDLKTMFTEAQARYAKNVQELADQLKIELENSDKVTRDTSKLESIINELIDIVQKAEEEQNKPLNIKQMDTLRGATQEIAEFGDDALRAQNKIYAAKCEAAQLLKEEIRALHIQLTKLPESKNGDKTAETLKQMIKEKQTDLRTKIDEALCFAYEAFFTTGGINQMLSRQARENAGKKELSFNTVQEQYDAFVDNCTHLTHHLHMLMEDLSYTLIKGSKYTERIIYIFNVETKDEFGDFVPEAQELHTNTQEAEYLRLARPDGKINPDSRVILYKNKIQAQARQTELENEKTGKEASVKKITATVAQLQQNNPKSQELNDAQSELRQEQADLNEVKGRLEKNQSELKELKSKYDATSQLLSETAALAEYVLETLKAKVTKQLGVLKAMNKDLAPSEGGNKWLPEYDQKAKEGIGIIKDIKDIKVTNKG